MISQLKNLSIFKNTDIKLIQELLKNNEIIKKTFHKGAVVHSKGEICHNIDLIFPGNLVAYSLSENGSEINIFEFIKDNIIGANLLFGENNRFPMNIYCTSESTIYQISKNGIYALLKDYEFVLEFMKIISLNSENMNKKIAMHSQRTLRDNLMDYLLSLSIEQKSKTIILPNSKKQLADYLGVQRPSLFREFKKLKEEGILEINNRIITLK